MKRWFTSLTSIIFVLFFCFILQEKPDGMLFTMYPNVLVLSMPQDLDWQDVEKDLEKLGKETNSLISLRIAQPTDEDGKTSHFSYLLFGPGKLPQGMTEASSQDQEKVDPVNSYSILRGSLSQERLAEVLRSHGAKAEYFPDDHSLFSLVLGYLPRPSLSFSLLLFGLLFILLITMRRIQDLRKSGIQVLSGLGRWHLLKASLLDDVFAILLGFFAAGLVSVFFLILTRLWNDKFILFLLTCAGIYAIILLLISLLMELIFWRVLRKSHLIDLIKGKMPIKSALAVLLIGQEIAFLAVGFGTHMVTVVYPLYQTIQEGTEAWAKRSDAFHFSMNLGAFDPYQKELQNQRDLAWYDFTADAFMEDDVFYCEHFLREQDPILPSLEESRKILLVSPSYLKREEILADPNEQRKMEHLQEGEFGLILSKNCSREEKVKAEKALQSYLYEAFWGKESKRSKEDIQPIRLLSAKADPVFFYNYEGKPPKQYLEDPYILVLTPKATGKSIPSAKQWSSRIDASLLFPSFDRVEQLLHKHGLSRSVSHIKNTRNVYLEQVAGYRFELITLLIGSIIGTLTAAVSFVVMNRLYFEHFRRMIFIRRISGFSFFKNHESYLKLQGGVMAGGLILLFVLSRKVLLNLLVFLVFMMMEGILLHRQMKRENRSAVTLLKGE